LPIALAAAVGLLALTAGGAAIGTYLAGQHAGQAANSPSDPSTSISPQPTSPSPSPRGSGGPGGGFFPGPGGPLGRPPPPGAPRPKITVIRRFNGHYTVFTVVGSRWHPGLAITVRLLGVGPAPTHPIVNRAGHFTFTLNGPHSYFHDKLSLVGTYQVVAEGPGGARALDAFVVHLA